MADTKVSDLNSITVADNNDVLYIVNPIAGTSNKITYQNLLSGVNDSITSLTSDVNTYTTTVLELSSEFQAANLDIGPLQSDVLQLSGDLDALSAAVLDIEDLPENFLSAIQFLSGAIDDNTAAIDFLSGAIDDNTATIANIRTLSGFTGTVLTTTTLTATHYIPIIINGASYNLLLNQ